ncbi:Rha family transcriptional regulator [Xanthobacter sp. TB0139]|uniref:Rha family transcriptional regulator n=1 Tax=Xanthobacter sp. TB0139 TaxID=3459178 RepID=UPI004039123E
MDDKHIIPFPENGKGVGPLTMSSREIADLTGKLHKNVVRDIEAMLNGLNSEPVDFEGKYQDAKGEWRKEYRLPKRETMILVSGYSIPLRAAIVDRWQELEEQNGTPVTTLPADVLETIRRDDGISRMLASKVTGIEKALSTLPALVETVNALAAIVQPSTPGVFRNGRTVGAILKAAGFSRCPKGLANRVGNWLEAAGCRVEGRLDTGVSRARLFDPDRAEQWLKAGGKSAIENNLAERAGQAVLPLDGRLTRRRIEKVIDEGKGVLCLNGELVLIDIRGTSIKDGEHFVVVTAAGDVKVDTPHKDANSHLAMGPRGAMASDQIEAVPGHRHPLPVGWQCMILGKVIDRKNVVPLHPQAITH